MVIARQAPQIFPPMIPFCSRFDSVLFTPKTPAIAGCFNFSRSPYVDPNAPKGGSARQVAIGTFDNFNPVIADVKGTVAAGIDLIYDSLMVPALNEVLSAYGLLAESVSHPDDFSLVTYRLRAGPDLQLREWQKEDFAQLRLPTTLPASPYQQGGRLPSESVAALPRIPHLVFRMEQHDTISRGISALRDRTWSVGLGALGVLRMPGLFLVQPPPRRRISAYGFPITFATHSSRFSMAR
jgi:hypothetical protein